MSVPSFRSEVMTIKVGSCAVVLARKYVVILIGLAGVIATFAVMRSSFHLKVPEIHKGLASTRMWDDFLFDCGPRTGFHHRSSTARLFEEKYRRRTFRWQGEVRSIREGFDVLSMHTKSVVMVQMYPPRHPRRDIPDVALLFDEALDMEVAVLNPGDWVEFEATMTAHGHRGDPEVMTLWHIGQSPRPEPLSSSGGNRTIYALDGKQVARQGMRGHLRDFRAGLEESASAISSSASAASTPFNSTPTEVAVQGVVGVGHETNTSIGATDGKEALNLQTHVDLPLAQLGPVVGKNVTPGVPDLLT